MIVEGEEGPLAAIRNKGARRASGEYIVFIDDDVFTTRDWLKSIVETFENESVDGVSGPAIMRLQHKRNRDLFRFPRIKFLYDLLFLDGLGRLPGHFTASGAWTTGASEALCSYEGEVHFLEACNMAFRRSTFEKLGGFDETYKGVGDWSEPDLCFRARANGSRLYFNPRAKLYHEPSTSGAFFKRNVDSRNRMDNYLLFSRRWIKPCFKHTLYKIFMTLYYAIKAIK